MAKYPSGAMAKDHGGTGGSKMALACSSGVSYMVASHDGTMSSDV